MRYLVYQRTNDGWNVWNIVGYIIKANSGEELRNIIIEKMKQEDISSSYFEYIGFNDDEELEFGYTDFLQLEIPGAGTELI